MAAATEKSRASRAMHGYVTLRITAEEKDRLHEMARREGRTASGQVRWLIMQYLSQKPFGAHIVTH